MAFRPLSGSIFFQIFAVFKWFYLDLDLLLSHFQRLKTERHKEVLCEYFRVWIVTTLRVNGTCIYRTVDTQCSIFKREL